MQDLNDKVTGNSLTATEWNQLPSEVQNLIESQGIALSGADLFQASKAIAAYAAGGQFFTGGGIADAYTVAAPGPRVDPAVRADGMQIRFIVPATNTGASTLNAFGTGADDIKLSNGSTDPAAGDLTINDEVTVVDRVTHFELLDAASEADPKIENSRFTATAWATFNATGTPAFLDEEGMASITDIGPGLMRLTFDTVMDNNDYVVLGMTIGDTFDVSIGALMSVGFGTNLVAAVDVSTEPSNSTVNVDKSWNSIVIFGGRA